jgi:hypothetical protein
MNIDSIAFLICVSGSAPDSRAAGVAQFRRQVRGS